MASKPITMRGVTLPALSLPLMVALVAAMSPTAAAQQAAAQPTEQPLPRTTGFAIPTLTEDGAPIPRSAGLPYAAKNLADRIVLTPGADPSREMAVAYRTNTAQKTAQVQLAISVDGPTLEEKAQTLSGITMPSESSYGQALYHQVRFQNLTPNTVYTEGNPNDPRRITLPSSSKHTFNLALGYEKGPISLRAAGTYRDKYLDELGQTAEEDRIVDQHFQLDLSAKYKVTDKVRLFAEWVNATDAPYYAYQQFAGAKRALQYEKYSWTAKFGVSASF
jgi:hypothetical protein